MTVLCPRGCGSVLVWRPAEGPYEGKGRWHCYVCGRSPGPQRILVPEEQPADSGSSMYKQTHHKGIPRSEWPTQSGRHPAVDLPQAHSERKTEWPVQGQSAIRSWTMHQGIGRKARGSE